MNAEIPETTKARKLEFGLYILAHTALMLE